MTTTIAAEKKEIPDNIGQRVSILRQLKKNLQKQRTRLMDYLDILEQESRDIDQGNLEKLTAHVEMERAVVHEIQTLQKVILPLGKLYRAEYPDKEREIPVLEKSLKELTEHILKRNEVNRGLLKREIAKIEKEISRVHLPVRKNNLFNLQEVSTLVDITT